MGKDDYQRQIAAKKEEQRKVKQKRNKLIAERDRLQAAYDDITLQKEDSERFRNELARTPDNIPYWRGSKHDDFLNACSTAANDASASLSRDIDRIMDDINWKIKKYNDEIYKTNTLIDSIGNAIRYLATLYKNATN